MFGRATIRLGIGPHSSCTIYCLHNRHHLHFCTAFISFIPHTQLEAGPRIQAGIRALCTNIIRGLPFEIYDIILSVDKKVQIQ